MPEFYVNDTKLYYEVHGDSKAKGLLKIETLPISGPSYSFYAVLLFV